MWTLSQAIERRRIARKIADLKEYMEDTQTDDQLLFDELTELRAALRKMDIKEIASDDASRPDTEQAF